MVAKKKKGDNRQNHGSQCLGVYRSNLKCTRARDGCGGAIWMNRPCGKCGEQRCKAHCKCGRQKIGTGRSKPRGEDQTQPKRRARVVTAPAEPVVVAPHGRVGPGKCELYGVDAWYRDIIGLLQTATDVEVASYQFDHPRVFDTLLKRLRGRSKLDLKMYVDAEMLAVGGPRKQKPRLRELHAAGAQIYVCAGPGRRGAFHGKALVVNRRFLFTGSANFTEKSQSNVEFCFKMTGAVVQDLLLELAKNRGKFPVWDGKD